jgi:dTDP-4-dehydrorhamnose 3,5-epimerase
MIIEETRFPGLFVIQPKVFEDERGYFFESFSAANFEKATGIKADFVQHNQSKSSKGVLRGLHFQREPYTQAKLVRVLSGRILDVVVDLREGSPTYQQHFSIEMSADDKKQLFVPRGFAHGFVILSETAEFFYCVDRPYAPNFDDGIRFDDNSLNIDWKLDKLSLILSEKDKSLGSLADAAGKFKF